MLPQSAADAPRDAPTTAPTAITGLGNWSRGLLLEGFFLRASTVDLFARRVEVDVDFTITGLLRFSSNLNNANIPFSYALVQPRNRMARRPRLAAQAAAASMRMPHTQITTPRPYQLTFFQVHQFKIYQTMKMKTYQMQLPSKRPLPKMKTKIKIQTWMKRPNRTK